MPFAQVMIKLSDKKCLDSYVCAKEKIMTMQVCWVNDLDKARETASKTKKPILLDFFNPN